MNLAADVRRAWPELFERIRAQCQWASDEIGDLDEYAAMICLTIVKLRRAAA